MSTKKVPHNTAREAAEHPIIPMVGAMSEGTSGFILNQEAQGQQSFVGSDTLPTDMTADDKKALEAAGVKFGGEVEGDPLFQYVELPKGWKKQATDHSMWSKLVDADGKERASIFYKAAFYDRRAFLGLA